MLNVNKTQLKVENTSIKYKIEEHNIHLNQ